MLKDLFSNGLLQLVNREIKYKSVQNDLDMADLLKKELTPESIINESNTTGASKIIKQSTIFLRLGYSGAFGAVLIYT